jgi:twitching motility protein PilT
LSVRKPKKSEPDLGVRVVDLTRHTPDRAATAALEASIARRHCVIPLRFEGERLLLAMADPTDTVALDAVADRMGIEVQPAMARRQDIVVAIETAYGPPEPEMVVEPDVVEEPEAVREPDAVVEAPEPLTVVQTTATEEIPMPEAKKEPEVDPSNGKKSDARVVRIGLDEKGEAIDLHDLLNQVLVHGASDLHLTNGLPPSVRVDGDLQPLAGYPVLDTDTLRRLIYGMLSQKQRDKFEEELELDFSYALPGKWRFRINCYVQRGALGAALRLIPFEIHTAQELGVPPQVEEFARIPRGLVVCTGPTGSGKTTTLAALVDVVNRERACHIMTVEDPIEFIHPHHKAMVNQREVGQDTHGFAQALRHVLRQDPDVILVGEMRDLETIQMAVTAAETGHLVFATLHTQDAAQTVDRIVDVFPPHQQQQIRVQLSGSLMGVVAQQLMRKRDGVGRSVACEVMVVTPAVRNLIREGKTHQLYSVMQSGGQFGMQTMDAALAELVRRGDIGYDAAKERCHNVEEFSRLAGAGPRAAVGRGM